MSAIYRDIFRTTLLAFLLMSFGQAGALTLRQCNQVASEINKTTPMNVDAYTVLKNTVCVRAGGRLVLNYYYELDIRNKPQFSQADLETLRPSMTSQWCTSPDLQALFRVVDIKYSYRNAAGRYLGEIGISRNDC